MPPLLMSATIHPLDNPRCKANNHWLSIKAHFPNGAMAVLLSLLPIKTAITFIMPNDCQITFQLPDLKDWKSLTLHWCSFSWWGNQDSMHFFAYKGCQYIVYELSPQINIQITQEVKPKIVDPQLMLIFRMGRWLCRLQCCMERQPIHRLC